MSKDKVRERPSKIHLAARPFGGNTDIENFGFGIEKATGFSEEVDAENAIDRSTRGVDEKFSKRWEIGHPHGEAVGREIPQLHGGNEPEIDGAFITASIEDGDV